MLERMAAGPQVQGPCGGTRHNLEELRDHLCNLILKIKLLLIRYVN